VKGERVLVIQLARLGDLVQTWPFLRRLMLSSGADSLELLLDERLRPLLSLGPLVAAGWGLDFANLTHLVRTNPAAAYAQLQDLAAGLRNRNFDRVYNLNFSRISLLLAYLVGNNLRGYLPARGGRDFLREPWLAWIYALVHARQINRVHLSDVFRHLAPAVPSEPGPSPIELKRGEPVIGFQLATRHPRRTWPLAAFARLLEMMVFRLGVRVWLLGTREERHLGEKLLRVLPKAGRERVTNFQGKTDLIELAGLMQQVHLLVSGDTGTLHLAAALGTRTLGLFLGPASCFETGPYGEGHYVIQAEPPCHPCAEAGPGCSEPICQDMIPAEGVADLVATLLQSGAVTAPPAFPCGTRIYTSYRDHLGVNYAPLGYPLRLRDVVGEAYRRAGARLLGLAGENFPYPGPFEDDRRDLEIILKGVENGVRGDIPPLLADMLTPLRVFQAEMARQKSWQNRYPQWLPESTAVKGAFKDALKEMIQQIS